MHITDTLTTDGGVWNKFDIFDADGKDVGIGRTALRTIASIAPVIIPGKIGKTYALMRAGQSLLEISGAAMKALTDSRMGE